MLIPQEEETVVKIFKCSACVGYYLEGNSNTCRFPHQPGSCCHYADKALSSQEVADVITIVGHKGIFTRCN